MSTHAQHVSRVTVADLFAIEDDKRYELFAGEVFVVPPPGTTHQLALTSLLEVLLTHIRRQDLGVVLPAPVAVILGEADYVEPDIVFVTKQHRDRISERGFEQPPDLLVEILSRSAASRRRDTTTKLSLYERAGVAHYWIVDPRARTLVAYELREGQYETAASLGESEVFRPSLFPGLEIALATIWPPLLPEH